MFHSVIETRIVNNHNSANLLVRETKYQAMMLQARNNNQIFFTILLFKITFIIFQSFISVAIYHLFYLPFETLTNKWCIVTVGRNDMSPM